MHIKIFPNSKRRIAFTDRRNGYFQYLFSSEDSENLQNGYFRGEKQFLNGFSCEGHSLSEAKSILFFPYGFSVQYEKSSLEVSLLIEEQAFYLSAQKTVGILGIIPEQKTEESSSEEEKSTEEIKNKGLIQTEWSVSKEDGFYVLHGPLGISAAAPFEFYPVLQEKNILLYASDSSGIEKSSEPFKNPGWYLTFEDSQKKAEEKALRLAKSNAIKTHKMLIDEFLGKATFDFGDKKFNEAVNWARFSGWLLAVKDHGSAYRGIWAGLPWFRDNWGRDTFISLCGILLVSGCFEEARDVLLGFAGFQDLNTESPTYGRIPNRYRDEKDVIYNTADGTLWFIRAVWEYAQYSGDISIFDSLRKTIEIALDADIKRSDEHGFLLHGDADTWMDARIQNNQPWSPRGTRANDVQALWYTALKLGALIEQKSGNTAKSTEYETFANKIQKSFSEFFWNKDCDSLADHLPEGGYGEWAKDMRVRPNQLFALTIPSVLDSESEKSLVCKNTAQKILQNVNRELVNPFGLFSLSPEDPLFHPEHENPNWYHKDAAYHNGTIWQWNNGAYVSACALLSKGILSEKPSAILLNYAKLILEQGCAGSLSENIHARPNEDGSPKLSGTFSQAWSVSEFCRNVAQDIIGFVPQLAQEKITFSPCLPFGCKELSATLPFGNNWKFQVQIKRKGKHYKSTVEWIVPAEYDFNQLPSLFINGIKFEPCKKIELVTSSEFAAKEEKHTTFEKFAVPSKWITSPFELHNLQNEFCGAEHKKDYLQNLILSGRMQSKCCAGENTAALEWYFDSEEFEKTYEATVELGALYSKKSTTFRLWSPTAKEVSVMLYKDGKEKNAPEPYKIIPLNQLAKPGSYGVWEADVRGDLHGVYYLYKILVHGVEQISSDPYAKACGVNGNRSMVVDLQRTNPEGWEKVSVPVLKSPSDAVIYEAHIADITSSPYWNGKKELARTFLGACQEGTSYNSVSTGFDHIKSLGITHVQLLPVFDFRTVDEETVNTEESKNKVMFGSFNWGYDPQNYACIEGSYSTNPYDGAVRIKEFKQMIQSYANAGIGIIMDVVYNHVKDGLHQGLGTSVPGYFYRVEGYSGAGEDTAGERIMFHKYMVDTLSSLLKEYKLCGFRFDLMGLHDLRALNKIRDSLRKIKKDVLIYGEGWDMYRAGKMEGATQLNSKKMPEIGFFNDSVRDGIKGPVYDAKQPGFIHDGSRKESVKFGIVGATKHPGVDNTKVEGTAAPEPWSENTWVSLNYTEIHDNITLRDKIFMTEQHKPEEYYDQMQKMALSLVLLSEGLPILHAGMEFCRSKEVPQFIIEQKPTFFEYSVSADGTHTILHNTYNICDAINNLDWERCAKKQDVVQYVRNLIKLRASHPAFRLSSGEQCRSILRFIDNKQKGLPEQVLAWELDGEKCGDTWKKILIVANPYTSDVKMELGGNGKWKQITNGIEFIKDSPELLGTDVVTILTKTVAIFAE